MATLNETIEQVQNVFNDIEGALQEQGVDTENLKPVDYADAVRGIVNNISVENVNFIPTLIFKYVADNGDKTERPSTPIGGKWNISEVTGNSTFTAPDGWFANIDDYRSVIVSKDILYMSYSIFKNNGTDQYLKWTTPIKISGTNGVDGKQGAQGEPGNIAGIVQTFYTPIYYGAVKESDIPSTPTCNYDVANGVLSVLTSGWTKEITTGKDGVIWYQSIATYKSNSSIVGCSVPVRISAAPTDLVEGVNNYYLLTDSLTPPSKDDPDWKLEPPTGFPVPTIDNRYLWTKVVTNYTHSYETGPIILVARYQKGLNSIDFDYYCAPSEDELKNLSEDQWFETSQEALVRTETYSGLDETTKYLWCRERFIFDDSIEDHYRIISTYTAAEKAAIIYPGGIFDKRTLYTRTPEQTLYVYYPEGIKLDSDGKINDDGKEYNYFVLKYSYDDVNHKISLNNGEYPSLEEVYTLGNWEKMESFDAIYSDIGVFKAANVGQFVFDDKYIFSQEGKEGNYTDFVDYAVDVETSEVKRKGIALAIEKGAFTPNILLNAITGEAKFGGGTSVLREDGSGYIADGKIKWKNNGDLLVGDNNGFMAFKDGELSLSGSVKIGVDENSLSNWPAFTSIKTELDDRASEAISIADDAKSIAEESNSTINDMTYLTNALGNHGSLSAAGVVMSQMVAVADVKDGEDVTDADVKAFLNGGDFAKDTDVDPHTEAPCGKLILAAGIPTADSNGSTNLKDRAKEANTRVYEDGCIYSNNLHLQDGATIGNAIKVTGDGIELNTNAAGAIRITESQGFQSSGNGMFVNVGGAGCSNVFLEVGRINPEGIYLGYCPNNPIPFMAFGDRDGIAMECGSGMFSGLRPKTRASKDIFGNLLTGGQLSPQDHTIDCVLENGETETIYLPTQPELGQCYEIWKWGNGILNINGNGKQIIRIGIIEQENHGIDAAFIGLIKLLYRGDENSGKWLMILHKTY